MEVGLCGSKEARACAMAVGTRILVQLNPATSYVLPGEGEEGAELC